MPESEGWRYVSFNISGYVKGGASEREVLLAMLKTCALELLRSGDVDVREPKMTPWEEGGEEKLS